MSKNKSLEEVNIRNRLVGAIALLMTGVIIIPMLLQGNGPGSGTKKSQLKEEVKELIAGWEESKTFVTRIKPVSEIKPQAVQEGRQKQGTPTLSTVTDDEKITQAITKATERAPEITNQVAVAKPVTAKAKKPAVVAKTDINSLKAQDVSRGWTVRIGTFSKPENAQRLIAKLDKSGLGSRYEVVTTEVGQATRIWLGPYEKRVTAGRALEKAKQVTGLKGYIKSYP